MKKKMLVSLTVVLVLVLIWVDLYPVSSQDPLQANVSVVVLGRNVIFMGESVQVRVDANVTPVNVQIFMSDGTLAYDGWVEANSTFNFSPKSDVYGLYTVKAVYGEAAAETWFWVADLRGMAIAPSTSIWVWKGVTCNLTTVLEAGKISTYLLTASFEGRSFAVEWLSEVFTKLKPTEVGVWSNCEVWHIKTYSVKNKIDSWIMNTYFGVKIRVNGTLEKATAFKWNFKNVYGNILWQLEGFRLPCESANLIFDYSDMASRSVGCTYTLDKTNMKLDVYLQPSFDIDPTIFQDGFESGDFSAWTGTSVSGGTATVVSTPTHHGSYAAKFETTILGGYARVYKVLASAYAIIHVRVYVYLNNLPTADGQIMRFVRFENTINGWVGDSGIKNVGGTIYPYRRHYIRGVTEYTGTTPLNLSTGVWYCFEDRRVIDGANGEIRIWLNGTEVLTNTGLDTDDRGNIDRINAQLHTEYITTPVSCVIDCVVVADTYIGPETAKQWNNVATWTHQLITRQWTLVETWTQTLITRTWQLTAEWNIQLITRVWQQINQWSLTLQALGWHLVTAWTWTLQTLQWHNIASWTTTIITRTWQTITQWTTYLGKIWVDVVQWSMEIIYPWFYDPKMVLAVGTVIFTSILFFIKLSKR